MFKTLQLHYTGNWGSNVSAESPYADSQRGNVKLSFILKRVLNYPTMHSESHSSKLSEERE